MSDADSEQREFWDRRADTWERRADALDAFTRTYGLPVMDALNIEPGERITDIGCGPGITAVELAKRVGPDGEVVGVDISAGMVAAATRRAEAAGLGNVRFVVANAQDESIGQDFDAAFSRFGVMFFTDPVAAFTNISGALRPGGRLACAVWGPLGDNPWMFLPTLSGAPVLKADITPPAPGEPGPFSFGDPGVATAVLEKAGFEGIAVDRVEGARVIAKANATVEVTTLLEVGPLGEAYAAADDTTRQAAIDAVLLAIEPYRDGDDFRLPGVALKVTAHRP